ncbi:MAG TPA: FAD-dependent oxidoreductase [Stellaceae bacterium]|nr:FAD-dependent oxidoreductase [Stellaceae bacterium]
MPPVVDLCVIGAGAAGLTTAAVAAHLGARTVLIERGRMGGECLNTGCVPSKALLAAAKAAHEIGASRRFGIAAGEKAVDFAAVHRHVHGVIAAIAPHDSAERFEGLGVEVIHAEVRFIGPREIMAGNRLVRARRIVIATGSEPAIPPIPGLDNVAYFTNETIFEQDRLPAHLLIVGAGAVGIELAQAYRRLGAQVTVVEAAKALPRDDSELAGMLVRRLAEEGVAILEEATVEAAEPDGAGVVLTVAQQGARRRLSGSHLLVAAGRRPRIAALDLDRAGVRHDEDGISVDRRQRTTARGVYAIGDVTGGPRLTHAAAYQAGIVIRNALFRLPARADYAALPWVTYTDPELAQIGLREEAARQRYGADISVVRLPLTENDRAQAERDTGGLVKLVARRDGRILGASLLAPHAGEMSHLWVLAIAQHLKLKDIAGLPLPYPTRGEAGKLAAAEFYKPRLFSPWVRRAVRALSWLP